MNSKMGIKAIFKSFEDSDQLFADNEVKLMDKIGIMHLKKLCVFKMLKVLSPVMCVRHSLTECQHLCLSGQFIYRSKYTKYAVNKVIQLNQENKLLFGPVLKAKDLKPKKRKSTKKKPVSEGISCIMEEARAQTSDTGDVVMEFVGDLGKKPVSKTSKTKKVKSNIEEQTVTSSIEEPPGPLDVVSSSVKAAGGPPSKKKVPKETVPPLPVFNFIFDFPLESQTDVNSGVCSDFNTQVEQLALRTVPTVSSILNRTQSDMARFFLQRWRENSIAELGKEAFYKQQEEIKRDGINLHACIQQYLSGRDVSDIQIQPRTQRYWESLQQAFEKIEEVKAVEAQVTHPHLQYRGTYDCIALYRNTLCVIDWKTSQKPKPLLSNTFDNPLQVAAYVGAVNANTDITQQYGPITHAALVIAYPWGEPAHVHLMQTEQCQDYWKQWLTRLNQYWNSVAREKGVQ